MTAAVLERLGARVGGRHVSGNGARRSARPGRPLRHDAPRRHAGREHHALARGQAADRPPARRVRHALHRGRLARLEPEGRRLLPRGARASAGRTRSWPPSARRAIARTRAEADPNLQELARAETPVVTIFGKSWLLHVIEVLGASPAENLDMIADSVRFIAERGRELVYDAEHYFDGYKADRDYAVSTLRAARDAGARTLVLCDTNGGTLTSELLAILADTRDALEADGGRAGGHLGHPHPQRRGARGRQLARRGAGGRPPRPGDDQRLRRALRQREHGQRPRRPRPEDRARAAPGRRRPARRPDGAVARRRRDRQRRPERLPAVRRALGVRAQGRRPRRRGGQGRAELPAHRADRGRQRGPARRVRARRPGEHARSGRSSSATSSTASSSRRCCPR